MIFKEKNCLGIGEKQFGNCTEAVITKIIKFLAKASEKVEKLFALQ